MGGVWSAIVYVYMLLIWAQLDGNDIIFKVIGRFRGLLRFQSAASRVNVGLGKDTRKRQGPKLLPRSLRWELEWEPD